MLCLREFRYATWLVKEHPIHKNPDETIVRFCTIIFRCRTEMKQEKKNRVFLWHSHIADMCRFTDDSMQYRILKIHNQFPFYFVI